MKKNNYKLMKLGINQNFPKPKMIADMALKETLKSISKYSSYGDERIPTFLDSDKPIIYIMKSILKAADIPENQFDKVVLKKRYDDFVYNKRQENTANLPNITNVTASAVLTDIGFTKDESEILFTIDQLFEEGWLIDCGSEWMHNCSPKRYKGLTFADSDREVQIVEFLSTLSDIEVCDVVLTFDPVKNMDLLKYLHMSVDELVQMGILYIDDEEIAFDNSDSKTSADGLTIDVINDGQCDDIQDEYGDQKYKILYVTSHTDIWRSLGPIVLSSLLDEALEDDVDYNATCLNYCRYMKYVYAPERYVEDKEALYNYCLKIIRTLNSDENTESQKINQALWMSANNKRTINIPSNPRLKEEYFGQHIDYLHELKYISFFSYTIVGIATDMCCRLYSHVPIDTGKELISVLSNSYYSILNHFGGYLMNPDLAVDALKREQLCYLSLTTIYGQLQHRATDRINEIYSVEKFADELWDVVYNQVSVERIDTSRDGVIKAFVEFLIYLGQSCGFGEEGDRHSVFGHNKTALTFFTILLEKYTEELGEYESVDGNVRGYIVECLNKEKIDDVAAWDVEITCYLRVLFAFARERRNGSLSYEQWMACSIEQLVKLYKRCEVGRFDISSISYSSIATIVEKYSEKVDADKLSQLANEILAYAKKIQSEKYTDKSNRRWGGYIGLCLLTSAINSKNVAVQTYEHLTSYMISDIDMFIEAIVFFQKSDRFFSRENIYQFKVEDLFKDCISTISLFNRVQRNRFIANVCDGSSKAFQKIDLLTWAALMTDNEIRIGIVESSTKDVGKVEAVEIVGVVVDSLIMPLDFTDIVNLAIWYKEEFLSEEDLSDNCGAYDIGDIGHNFRKTKLEDTVFLGLINIAEAMLDRYKKWERQVGSHLKDRQKRVSEWIASADRQLEYIKNGKEALKQNDDDFYRGIGYLEHGNEDNLVEAVRIFDNLYENRDSVPAGINLMSALAQLINVRLDKGELDNNKEITEAEYKEDAGKEHKVYDGTDVSTESVTELLRRIEEIYDEINTKVANGDCVPDSSFYYNMLLAYVLCNKPDDFMNVYKTVPENLILEPFITELAVRVYLSEGKKDKAQQIYARCKAKYVLGKKLDDIKMIIAIDGQSMPMTPRIASDMGRVSEPTQEEIERVLNYLKIASGDKIMKAFGSYAKAKDDILQRMGISRLNDSFDKILVLEILLSAALDLERYSRSLIWKWKDGIKLPHEDTFNRTLMTFINRRETRILGYKAVDQIQAGRPGVDSDRHDNGNYRLLEDEELCEIHKKDVSQISTGRIDIQIDKDESSVCIVEGIKVLRKFDNNNALRDDIVNHICKVQSYDTKRIHMYAMMIYSGSYEGNYSEIYEQYKNLLLRLKDGYSGEGKDEEGCYIVDVITNISPRDLGISGECSKFYNLCITVHRDSRKHQKTEKIIMYHLFLDIWQ